MIYLVSGSTRTLQRITPEARSWCGFLFAPKNGNSFKTVFKHVMPWAADNGCFHGLDEVRFRRMLCRLAGLPRCLFVVVPDKVGDARTTRFLWDCWRPEVAICGQPLAFVAQDGAESIPPPWEQLDALFIGGSTRWKLSRHAAALAEEAKRRGKWAHMGRVNSYRRLVAAYDMGCDSVDGSSASRWGDKYIHKYVAFLRVLHSQTSFSTLEIAP